MEGVPMFGWFRNLTKRATIVDDSLVLDAPADDEHPVAPARHDRCPATAPTSPVPDFSDLEQSVVEPPTSDIGELRFPADLGGPVAPSAPSAPAQVVEEPVIDASVDEPAAPVAAAEPIESTVEAPAEPRAEAPIAAEPTNEPEAVSAPQAVAVEPAVAPEPFTGVVPAPSARPAMPLSAHPNFAGLDLAVWEPSAPRLLQPEAALTPEAQQELLKLFDDLFGPCGRYRLEWRSDRRAGDDAMFAAIMTADLLRRVQNTIADVAELDRIEPLKVILPAPKSQTEGDDEGQAELPKAS